MKKVKVSFSISVKDEKDFDEVFDAMQDFINYNKEDSSYQEDVLENIIVSVKEDKED